MEEVHSPIVAVYAEGMLPTLGVGVKLNATRTAAARVKLEIAKLKYALTLRRRGLIDLIVSARAEARLKKIVPAIAMEITN